MNFSALLHRPMSEYAHGLAEDRIVIRLRTAKDDIPKVTLFYGDTACRKTPIDFYPEKMEKIASDLYFDYYEADIKCRFNRLYYYFLLEDGNESFYYFSDFIRTTLPDDRSEYYKLPFNHRADIALTPDWVKDAVIYNIFPDSFASDFEYVSGVGLEKKCGETITTHSKNGGTIKGIEKNVSYLKDLGINCIYLNPLFAACEYHKYDTVDYFKVDPCFGTNEDFKSMVNTLHDNGIKVIIDGVFNHCGWKHFAFEDVVKNQEKSKYVHWFYDLKFPVERPDNPEDYPTYACFAYERLMPKLDTANPEVCEYLCSVGEYWVKEFGIDGWRLDVASEVNDEFWRFFRRRVKAANPQAFIIGEVWEKGSHWLKGDMFDSCMNYDLRKFSRYFIAEEKIDSETFNAGLTDMYLRYKKDLTFGQLNLLDSHDVSRFLSVCNEDTVKYEMAVVFQMTFIGAPSIFYGDEQGLTGLEEADYRQPMKFLRSGELYDFYRELIQLRKSEIALRRGDFKASYLEKGGLYAFDRSYDNENIRVVLNNSADIRNVAELIDGRKVIMSKGLLGSELGRGYVITKL